MKRSKCRASRCEFQDDFGGRCATRLIGANNVVTHLPTRMDLSDCFASASIID